MRCSTNKQDLKMQENAIIDFMKSDQKIDVNTLQIEWFKDVGISGKTMKRPGLQKMIEKCLTGKFDNIIVYKLDRLSRCATSAIRLILKLNEAGIGFISASQPVLNLGKENPFQRTMLAAFAEIAQIERETTVARVKAGLAVARRAGKKLGRPETIDREKIQEAARAYCDGKGSLRSLAKKYSVSHNTVRTAVLQIKEEEEKKTISIGNAALI